jgi:hypothetical protein
VTKKEGLEIRGGWKDEQADSPPPLSLSPKGKKKGGGREEGEESILSSEERILSSEERILSSEERILSPPSSLPLSSLFHHYSPFLYRSFFLETEFPR